MNALPENQSLLLFRIGPVTCCAPVQNVEAIINPPERLTAIPGQAAFVAGIFQYRSETASVVCMRYKFGLEKNTNINSGKAIMVRLPRGLTGFLVDEIIEVTNASQYEWSEPPRLIPKAVFDKTLLFKDQMVLHTDFARLFAMQVSGPFEAWMSQHGQAVGKEVGVPAEDVEADKGQMPEAEPESTQPVDKAQPAEPAPVAAAPEPEPEPEVETELEPEPEPAVRVSPETPAAVPAAESDATTVERGSRWATERDSRGSPHGHVPARSASVINFTGDRHKPRSAPPNSDADPRPQLEHPRDFTARRRDTNRAIAPLASSGQAAFAEKVVANEEPEAKPGEAAEPEASAIPEPVPTNAAPVIAAAIAVPEAQEAVVSEITLEHETRPIELPADEGTGPWPWMLGAAFLVGLGVAAVPWLSPSDGQEEPPRLAAADSRAVSAPMTTSEEARPATDRYVNEPLVTPGEDQNIVDETVPPAVERTAAISAEAPESPEVQVAAVTEPSDDVVVAPTKTPSSAIGASAEPESKPILIRPPFGMHTVVRGDTLWQLSIRFLSDPFRYPELARLSEIKNPDLIYPGDHVRYPKNAQPNNRTPD